MHPIDALPTEPLGIEVDLTDPMSIDAAMDGAGVENSGISVDGDSILVSIDGTSPLSALASSTNHRANLADLLDEQELTRIAQQVDDWVTEDKSSRSEWETCLKDGMETLGIAPLSADDRPFKGATTVTHPVIAEAAVQFQSRAVAELFPSAGPVKAKLIPGASQEVIAQGERIEGFMNWYLTEDDEDYFDDSDQMLFILSLHGHIFRKVFVDPVDGKAKARFVTASDLLVPYTATSLKEADHYTQVFTMPLNNVRRAMESGHFRTVEFKEGMFTAPERDAEQEAKDDSDRREPMGLEAAIPELYECHCDLVLGGMDEGAGIALPYIVTVERNSNKVLSIYRNWDETDARRLKQIWFASYKYLQGLGFYGLGLFHVLGNIAASCGAILRAIIDAGALNNLQGGFSAKLGGDRKQDLVFEMGVWKQTELTPEELKTAFYTPPFKEPSQTLMLTVKWLMELAQRFSSTTETMVGEGPNSGPVGTTLALIEQGSKIFSAVHKRNHRSLTRELRMLQKLFLRMNLEYPYPVGPHRLQTDLDGRVDVTPVSDPTIVSNTQRIAMAQGAQQLISNKPQLYGPENQRMVDLKLLQAMKIPDAERLVADYSKQVPQADPVSENAAMLTGKPVQAYPEQEHDAHIAAHLNFIGALPPQGQRAIEPALLAHIAEHAALKYQKMMAALMQRGMTPEQAGQMPLPPLVPQLSSMPGEPSLGQ